MAGVAFIALLAAGCASMNPPERLYSVDQEFNDIRTDVTDDMLKLKDLKKGEARRKRNEIIAARKYAIDIQYTKYEAALTHEAQLADFGAKAANIALATTAEFVPVVHTKDMLNGIALGTTNLEGAYNAKILREKLIENVQSSMRSARHERAAVIYSNMHCSIKSYPMAMALSDLEAYYRAGTFPAGLIKLSHTVTSEENKTAATADAQKSGDADAQAKLAGMAVEARLKAESAMAPGGTAVTVTNTGQVKIKGKHKCTLEDTRE